MSLLLEALKKAERAKEQAQRRARGEPEGPSATPLLDPEPLSAEPAPEPPVRTRDQLPDIRQPLTLEGDDQAARPAPAAAREPAPAAPPPASADVEASRRASARKVFEAKFKEPNPRLPFYITMGALGVFAVGVVVYFWMQLQPPPALVNTNPPRPSHETQVAAADLKPTPTPAQQAPASAIPGLP